MLVHVTYEKESGKDARKLYIFTDVSLDPADILLYYQSRYQIEFLYRDGKQHTGLNDSQARSENKLHFQFNASLTSINIAKAIHWLNVPREYRGALNSSGSQARISMSDIKTMNHNILLLNRFLACSVFPHTLQKINTVSKNSYFTALWLRKV